MKLTWFQLSSTLSPSKTRRAALAGARRRLTLKMNDFRPLWRSRRLRCERTVREERGGGQGREGVQLPDSLMDEAVFQSVGPGLETPQSPPWWQQTEEAVCRVGGITCNAEGFAGETGAVDVLEGGERDTNDLLSCSHYPLKGRVAGAIPHSDAASQNALDCASVEGAHDGGRGSGSSEFAQEVETLLCFLGQCRSVVGPGEVLCDVHTQELGAAHSLHGRTINGQRSMQRVHSPEVNNNLLRSDVLKH